MTENPLNIAEYFVKLKQLYEMAIKADVVFYQSTQLHCLPLRRAPLISLFIASCSVGKSINSHDPLPFVFQS